MTIRILLALILSAVVLPTRGAAQHQPDFSGHWTLVADQSVMTGPDGAITIAVFGSDFSITTDGGALMLALANEWPFTYRVNLDGTPTERHDVRPDGKNTATTVTARWEESTLVITMAVGGSPPGTPPVAQPRRLTLRPDGTLMVEAPWGPGGSMVASVYRWLGPI